jgi:hypothetical protein
MLETKNGLIKIVDLKETSLENLQIRNTEIQIILKSEVHTALRDYKSTFEMKNKKFHFNEIQEIENASNDPLLFWKKTKKYQ